MAELGAGQRASRVVAGGYAPNNRVARHAVDDLRPRSTLRLAKAALGDHGRRRSVDCPARDRSAHDFGTGHFLDWPENPGSFLRHVPELRQRRRLSQRRLAVAGRIVRTRTSEAWPRLAKS